MADKAPAIECKRCGTWYSPGDASIARKHMLKKCKPKKNP